MKKHLLNLRALLMLCMIFVIGGGSLAFAEEVTVTSTFTNNKWAVNTGEPTWTKTGANATSFESASPSRGVQTTLKNIKSLGLSLTNSTIKELGNITSVSLIVSSNGTGGSISSVKVGETNLKCGTSTSYTVKKSNDQTATFTTSENVKGDIVITFASTATNNSLYVKSISVTYTGSTPSTNYSVSWKVNGEDYTTGNPSTKVAEGYKVTTLPNAPADINGKVFVGWTNDEIVFSQNDKPQVLFTSPEESPIVTKNTIYHAVFAKQDGEGISSEELTGTEILNLGTLAYDTEKTYSSSSLEYVIHGHKTNATCPWIQLKSAMGSYIKITAPQNITKVDFTITSASNSEGGLTDISKHTSFAETVGLVTSDCSFSETSENIGSTSEISNNKATINTTSGSNAKEVYIKVSKGARIWGITTYYGSVQYSGYTTKVSEPPTPATHTLTLVAKDNDIYYATFSSSEAVIFPSSDVKVDAVSVEGSTLNIAELAKDDYLVKATNAEGYDVLNGYYVPANTGVLIQSRANSATYYTPYKAAAVSLPANQLKAAPAEGGEFTPEQGDHLYYKLAYNNYTAKEGLGFYWGAAYGGVFSVKAGTAYLAVPNNAEPAAKGFCFSGTTTGINNIDATETGKTREIYNLAGQKMNTMGKPGMYIVNGKKTIVRK